ncbi:hypothetical protein AKJ16_DCAP07788 [Drosera capensis]
MQIVDSKRGMVKDNPYLQKILMFLVSKLLAYVAVAWVGVHDNHGEFLGYIEIISAFLLSLSSAASRVASF